MGPLVQPRVELENETAFWQAPLAWLREKKLSRGFWIFYTALLFFHLGFGSYFFLFNLYLLDLHFNERVIGLVGGSFALGSAIGALPAGLLAKKIGLRRMLLICYCTTPVLAAMRVLVLWERAQIGLGFIAGLVMCMSGVCVLPALARLTTKENRALAFGMSYSTSIGEIALGGVVVGNMPHWLSLAGLVLQPAEAKRVILLGTCGVAALGLVALFRLHVPPPEDEVRVARAASRWWKLHPFMWRFFPAMALWTAVLTSFAPFANVYLAKVQHLPLARIGLIYSSVLVLQFLLGLMTPVLFRRLGLVNGIVVTQLLTAAGLVWLAVMHAGVLIMPVFIGFSAIQWMSTPGLENLLMSEVPDHERGKASAMLTFSGALVGAGATAGAGALFAKFGYPHVMLLIAAVAVGAALLFRALLGGAGRVVTAAQASALD